MTIRQVDLFDLPRLYRNHSVYQSFDTTDLLAYGAPLGLPRAISRAIPFGNIFTVIEPGTDTRIAAITHYNDQASARLAYLSSSHNDYGEGMLPLVAELAKIAANRGAFHLIAETSSDAPPPDVFRGAGFSTYTTQSIYQFDPANSTRGSSAWRAIPAGTALEAKLLYEQITPPLIQSVEPFQNQAGQLYACAEKKAYARVVKGPAGVVVVPIVHPDVPDLADSFRELALQLGAGGTLPVYFVVRSAISWFTGILREVNCGEVSQQQILVKHLAKPIQAKDARLATNAQGVRVLTQHINNNK